MSSKKILNPNLPGGFLSSTNAGDELTAGETLLVQNLNAGTYENVTPTGAVNGVNVTFTLPAAPSPVASLKLYNNGQLMKAGGEDFTLAGVTITFVNAPLTGSILLASFLVNA